MSVEDTVWNGYTVRMPVDIWHTINIFKTSSPNAMRESAWSLGSHNLGIMVLLGLAYEPLWPNGSTGVISYILEFAKQFSQP